jgi:hypothetical protein
MMTPEERLRRLAGAEPWGFEPFRPDYTPSRVEAAPARRPWVIGFATVATVLLAVIVIAGVVMWRGGTEAPIAPPTPTGPSTPTPGQTPTAVPTVQPAQVFDGDCSTMLSNKQVEAVIGSLGIQIDPSTNKEVAYDATRSALEAPGFFAVIEHGGVGCQWGAGDSTLILSAVPEGAVPAIPNSDCSDGPSANGRGSQLCLIEYTAHGVRYSGGVSAKVGEAAGMADAIYSDLEKITPDTTVAAPVYPAGTWPPADCDGIRASLDATGNDFTLTPTNDAFESYSTAKARLVAETVGQPWGCFLVVKAANGDDGMPYVNVEVYPGGAWMTSLVQHPSKESESVSTKAAVPGFDAAYTVTEHGEPDKLYLFRGPNMFSVQVFIGEYATFDDLYGPYVDALNALADNWDANAR